MWEVRFIIDVGVGNLCSCTDLNICPQNATCFFFFYPSWSPIWFSSDSFNESWVFVAGVDIWVVPEVGDKHDRGKNRIPGTPMWCLKCSGKDKQLAASLWGNPTAGSPGHQWPTAIWASSPTEQLCGIKHSTGATIRTKFPTFTINLIKMYNINNDNII